MGRAAWRVFMSASVRSVVVRYGAAIIAIAVATGLRLLLDPLLGVGFPFALVFLAVLVVARFSGFGPALAATLVGALASSRFLLPPREGFFPQGIENQAGTLLYLGTGAAIALLGGEMRAARQRAEDSAREAAERQERWRATLASIGDAVIVTDTRGSVVSLNGVAERLTGWPQASAVGMPIASVFRISNELTGEPVASPTDRVLREGIVVGLANHTVLTSRDGTRTPIDDSAAPIRNVQGELVGVVLIFRDVTEARRADVTRRRLAVIVESSHDAIISKTLDGDILSWNAAAERLYGYSAAEAIGRNFAMLVPEERSDEVTEIRERFHRGEQIDQLVTVRRRRDGTLIVVAVSYSPIRDAEGDLVGISSVSRDVTEQRRAETARQELETRFSQDTRFLADASATLARLIDFKSTLNQVAKLAVPYFADWCAVDLLDEEGRLERLAIAHVDPAKVELGRELFRRYPPDPSVDRGVWRIIRTGESRLIPEITDEFLTTAIPHDEMRRIFIELGIRSYLGVPLKVRDQILGAITFYAAESGRRYDERSLALAEDLASRAAVAIENAQLYQAARDADRRKDEFLAMLAHELRNPLAPIRNALHILKTPVLDAVAAEHVREVAERQVHHLTRLVDDLLDVSRLMQGRIELRRERVDLPTVCTRAVETSLPVIEAEEHELTISLPDQPLEVDVDVVRMAQVVSNLLNNAAKYTERGGRIWLTAAREGDEAVIRVRDSGIGISPGVLPGIFEMFMQGAPDHARSQGGLGIGLTLVKRLVEMHAGRVEVCSEGLGRGSEFTVRLPVLTGEPAETPPPEGDAKRGRAVPAGGHRRVLIVDDNIDAATTLGTLLRLRGHNVQVVHSGAAALAAVAQRAPEYVLLDIGMPGMDGYEVARRIRELHNLNHIVIVALTGWGQEQDRRRSHEAGFDMHLVKPVDPAELQSLLEREFSSPDRP